MDGRQKLSREDFGRLYPKLTTKFRSLGASAEEAEDLAQDVFIRANARLGSFEGRSELDTWVISIAKRVWLNSCRYKSAVKRHSHEVSMDAYPETRERVLDSTDVQEQFLTRDLFERVQSAICRLPDAMREVLVMYCNGLKYREIAERLSISESRVASLIHQARTKIRKRFTT